VAGDYGESVGEASGGAVEEVSNGEVEEGDIFSAGVAEDFSVFVNGHAADSGGSVAGTTHCLV
jgi:hypothetical protein